MPVPCIFFACSLPLIFRSRSPLHSVSLFTYLLVCIPSILLFFPIQGSYFRHRSALCLRHSRSSFSSLISSLTPPSLRAEPASRSCLLVLIIRLLLLLAPASQFSSFISSVGVSFFTPPLISSHSFSSPPGGLVIHTSVRTFLPVPPCSRVPRPPRSGLPVTYTRSSRSLLHPPPCCEAPLPSASASASSPLPAVVPPRRSGLPVPGCRASVPASRRQDSHAWQSTHP